MEPVTWGILGASNFAATRMGPALHAAKGSCLAALATASPEKAARFAAFAPGLKVHESYAALLDDPQIEAVYIPLPNTLHVEWGIKALEAGKHVLIEKPLAMTAAEIAPLIAARDAAGKCAAEAYMIVHHPQWQLVRRWLDEGRIGRLKHADVTFTYDNPDPANIRNRADVGGGSIPDIGVYAYSSIRFAARAEPVALHARLQRENGVDTFAQVWGEMAGPDGAFSFAALTSTRLYPRQEVTFQGEAGRITLSAPFNAGVFGEGQVSLHGFNTTETHRFPGVNQYVLQVEAFIAHIRAGTPFAWTLEEAQKGQAMIDMVRAGEI
ncbi:Gfo/Idh/MocA family protein [Rhodobacter lacus]|uniref:Gfo/Idh/MocA family protein n=1 Tax=Rhodobacter lacus TaxID=1641972 RepID=A0ABW5A6J2_9RHOB